MPCTKVDYMLLPVVQLRRSLRQFKVDMIKDSYGRLVRETRPLSCKAPSTGAALKKKAVIASAKANTQHTLQFVV
ncbi:hypothetical protein ACS0TY_024550 [Phlomoides rotata]